MANQTVYGLGGIAPHHRPPATCMRGQRSAVAQCLGLVLAASPTRSYTQACLPLMLRHLGNIGSADVEATGR